MKAPMMQPPHGYPAAYPRPFARQPERNVALIVVGAILLVIALGAGFVFLMNLNQYLTIEDKWANDPFLTPAARDFGVRIIKEAALRRMMTFGPVSGLFGIVGLVLGILGLRKK
jgi:hypothetical protein